MTSHDIQKLLKAKHSKDIYVPECKNGQSYVEGLLRLDGLAIARSYANPMVTGYEIKVSRYDFMGDEKYHHYLKYCNCFYFVCPPDLIQPNELPDNIGLLWSSKNCKKLYKKKKAVYIDQDIPADIYKYILITRAVIKQETNYYVQESKAEYWDRWLEKKEIDRDFGHHVRGSIRRAFIEKMEIVEEENKRLRKENEEYAHVKEILTDSGINTDRTWNLDRDVEARLKELKSSFPLGMEDNIKSCISQLTKFIDNYKGKE